MDPRLNPSLVSSNDSHLEEFVDPVDGTRWLIDVAFMDSNWTCIWGNGCEGIRNHLAADLEQGCCSVGAHLIDDDEARLISALGLGLDPARFQNHGEASMGGFLADGPHHATRVVDDACIFFNKPGFDGGTGCALHFEAVAEGDSPMDWKPSICWQAPLKVDEDERGVKTLRPWGRADWGDPGQGDLSKGGAEELAWCCTEPNNSPGDSSSAFVGDRPVSETLHAELRGLVGPEIAVQIRSRASEQPR